ncbi:MAG TPA: uroporphyrinogen-III synthase [Burkholderiaceae bacterium]|jgi:uroporphyrinogen-III synthase|nr:uroporphyrinogen-III synthase [Burkholderiaceae bacterium]
MTKHIAQSVIITRPRAQADALARRVAALGRDAIVFPLIEIHPLADPAPLLAALADLSSYAMVAFVSPNAIDAVFAVLRSWPMQVALAVMGEGSRRALGHYGVTVANATIISPVDPERTDSQTLLDALDVGALRDQRVLIVRGEAGRELLADALRAAGAQVTQVAAYRRQAPDLDQARRKQLGQLLDSRNDWIVTSSEALRIAMQMAEQACGAAGVAKMQQQTIIVPHVRIQETAQMLGFRHITLTGSGDERLLAALQS